MRRLLRSKPGTPSTVRDFFEEQNFYTLHSRPQGRSFWMRGKGQLRICAPIVETHMKKAIEAIEVANSLADLIELRTDYLKEPKLVPLLKIKKKPVIITSRREEEGGRYRGNEEERFRILKEAVTSGAEYVDVEIGSRGSLLRDLIKNQMGTKLILSFHDFQKTPPPKQLRELFNRMIRLGADIVKIVTFARSWEDNLLVLSLIPFAKERRQEIVVFCMGEKGKMSRVFAPWMGAAWTYASLRRDRSSAPGQLTVKEMKEIWERLR